jgi:hypothetical protein
MTRLRPRTLALVLALTLACTARQPPPSLGPGEPVADGVQYFHVSDRSLIGGLGPIDVSLLRLDPAKVRLDAVLSNDEVLDTETVASIAERHHAIAAINGGYFNRTNGEPTGLLKVAGELVSDSTALKGAVAITSPLQGRTELLFDLLAAKLTMRATSGDRSWVVPIDGVDTTRERGKLMLYTPAYHADADTAPGTEWVLDGSPLQVVEVRPNAGRTPIPRTGAVLSFGGITALPGPVEDLVVGTAVAFQATWRSARNLPADRLDRATHIVNGAGLLRRDGEIVADWDAEALNPEAFVNARHPRTLIGTDARGMIWLATIDGRQPERSIGMTFADLQRLCDRLELTNALNLDGGGSTTMVMKGKLVNVPSDPGGARPVSDALVVLNR